MKVGIFTFHGADNYGAVLQAYGLMKSCENLGYDSYIVDYLPEYILDQYQYFKMTGNLKSDICKIVNWSGNAKKKKGFDSFRQNYLKTVPYKFSGFDCALYGSDQIWNPNIKGGFDAVYFGDNEFKARKNIAYAASVGKSNLTLEEKKEFVLLTNNLTAISVRESSTAEMIKKFLNRDIECVIDPSLLLEAREWDKLASSISHLPEKYIFIYDVNKNPETIETAKKISDKTGLPIVELTYAKTRLFTGTYQIIHASPEQFVYLIKNADYIVTSSFHGTAFSIIYRKNFYTIQHNAYSNRMYDLLDKLGLLHRFAVKGEISLDAPNFSEAETKLDEMRNKSLTFIKNSFKMQE